MIWRAVSILLIAATCYGQQNLWTHHAAAASQQATTAATPWYLRGGVSAASCVAAYAAKGAASLTASRDNLASAATTYDLIDGVAPMWDTATGWTFNGSSQYLKTSLVPDLSSQSWTIIVKYSGSSTNATDNRCAAGVRDASTGIFYVYPTSLGSRLAANGFSTVTGGALATSGVIAIAGKTLYHNGTSEGDAAATTGTTARDIWIGGRNASSGGANLYVGNISSVSIYSATLTQAQVQAIGAAMP